tara:strand:+ start:21107 stop:21592 length:486 start_codon:yes stop_codon:yes gene_type:complete
MRREKIEISFMRSVLSDLNKIDQKLINSAKESIKTAYAPYSGFMVGASVLLDNNEIINGSNQENSAFPSGICAERVALFYASSRYPNIKINTIAISAIAQDFDVNEIVAPCGACRQVMAEYQQKQSSIIRVILNVNNDVLIIDKVDDLLPLMFTNNMLKKY